MASSHAERRAGAPVLSPHWLVLGLLGLVLAGMFLRLHDLGKRSLWVDELFTVGVALYHPLLPAPGQRWYRPTSVLQIADGDTFLSVKAGEQSPPLYDLLAKASVHAFGPTEFAARLPAALAACALLLWVAWFAWRVRDPWLRRVLFGSLALLAVHPGLVAYAQEGRAYSLGASLAGMGLVLWLQRWHRGATHWTPPGWGETALFLGACYSHYNAAALVCLLLLPDAVLTWRRRSRESGWRLGVLGALFLAWVAVNARTILFTAKGGVAWRLAPGQQMEAAVRDLLNMLHPAWVVAAVAVALAIAVTSLVQRRKLYWTRPGMLALALAGMVLGYAILASAIAYRAGMQHPRYYIFAVPLAVLGMAAVWAMVSPRWVSVGVGVVWLALVLAPRLPGTALQGGEDFRSAVRAAAQDADAGTLFLYPWRPNQNLYRVYLERYLGKDSRPQLVPVSGSAEIPAVCARLSQAPRVAVMAHASQTDIIDEVHAACGSRWPHRERFAFAGAVAEHWR